MPVQCVLLAAIWEKQQNDGHYAVPKCTEEDEDQRGRSRSFSFNFMAKIQKKKQMEQFFDTEEEKSKAIHEYLETNPFFQPQDGFWPQQLVNANAVFKAEYTDNKQEDALNDDALDIKSYMVPVFTRFVRWFFINSDQQRNKNIDAYWKLEYENPKGKSNPEWYRHFLQSWRKVPIWYRYSHDILLLELVLRNGLDLDKICNDLIGRRTLYQKRLKQDGAPAMDEFHKWCRIEFNLIHRLKYVTNVMVKNLQNPQYLTHLNTLVGVVIPHEEDRPSYEISSSLFSDYQEQIHCDYLQTKPLHMRLNPRDLYPNAQDIADKTHRKRRCCRGCCRILSNCCCNNTNVQIDDAPAQLPTLSKYTRLNTSDNEEERDGYTAPITSIYQRGHARSLNNKRTRYIDPFEVRNIKTEIEETLQAFDLLAYGPPLVRLIVDQINKNNREAYWYVLGELLYALPYTLAIQVVTDERAMEVLRYVEHEKLNAICERLVDGSLFRCSPALAISKFFDDLADMDPIAEETWRSYARAHEHRAYDEINQMKTDHLLYLALNLPLTQHHGESLLNLALKESRIDFLNNSRIHHVVHHMYQFGELGPSRDIHMTELSYNELLRLIVVHPFRFYYSAQGYHWISGTVFMCYLAFVCYYVYSRPIGGAHIHSTADIALEATLWIMNAGYVVYEMTQCANEGITGYLNLDRSGESNTLDIVISVCWVFLFILRMIFIGLKWEFEGFDSHSLQNIYVFVFAVQIVLLTIRSLALFSNSQYLGKLYRAMVLMSIEIFKFFAIFGIFVIGFLFGLWLISAANGCAYDDSASECEEYEAITLWDALIYVFQVFIGTGDLSGVADQTMGILFMVAATLFGALILTNLLIALMTTEYEHVQERAKAEVIYYQTALTVELSRSSRLFPPPLNIVVLFFMIVIDFFNFCLCMIWPKWNIYSYLDHHVFAVLKHYNLWQCEVEIEDHATDMSCHKTCIGNVTRQQILKWYFVDWWLPRIVVAFIEYLHFIFCCCHDRKQSIAKQNDGHAHMWRVYHKSCYGYLDDESGVTMAEYLSAYENEKKQRIALFDKQLLNELTANTLFCGYCYKPFLRDTIEDELITPYVAIMDLVSAITFIVIPIAWIPLIILFFILSIKEHLFGHTHHNTQRSKWKVADFDREYYSDKFKVTNH